MKKTILILFFSIITTNVVASEFKIIKCESERMNKAFLLRENSVTFIDKENDPLRAIASSIPARTQYVNSGINQMLNHEDKKYFIHISNLDNFSDVDDYIEMKTMEGHNIMYPIHCRFN
ncbi:MAG: hypothetical protein A2381_03315 [Bdellovibrionales bacterium RIFOXYB1_FULL_37_110]|nr:MAG: hypothetical protein A2181_00420 [Bdellovibrionales bacterium RIFOXYA1_FULL_38_20]OFZ48434.1 MAG: hypothetical protein A2417_03805 [Bdellovibrionales bacterium RIFOXYC1_FULL_37_79]OFZ57955.1 MAG: hypothetical protein A2381_03315 [Bdellovibrionales bacterium RIFOXYB1_FULL_37_110]OFZ63092.1 MAG: hypothetical protein A2577_15445 [Bdellovibrionales bacterium RIFOXYD1_FULL_36_51]